ncbi:hypothetical protein [Brevundimonas sp. UBA7664]|uniref:hypothetical protein n=1 Tax=Brevundimonas sp. UBA7664 TaxID=1946141 RepID=UPI0025C72542|nr:hypothetical protein [Brevundimonas sp. UBA7664]
MKGLVLAGAIGLAAITSPGAAHACFAPYVFDPARETHDALAVATATSREDVAEFVPSTLSGAESSQRPGWIAELRTVGIVRGRAPSLIVVAQEVQAPGECWSGIEIPEVGQTYAVYLDEIAGEMVPTRMILLDEALKLDPAFGRREQ